MRLLWLFAWLSLVFGSFAALLGIDFGQDSLKAAIIAPGLPFEIVLSPDSKRKEQIAVALKPTHISGIKDYEYELIFGSRASALCPRLPSACFTGYKTLFGVLPRSENPADQEILAGFRKSHPGTDIIETEDGIAFRTDFGIFSVKELLALQLADTQQRAAAALRTHVGGTPLLRDVVLTVPPFFGSAARRAVLDAVELAGLRAVTLVDDGVAVALNYLQTRSWPELLADPARHVHAVFDMGSSSAVATVFEYKSSENGSVAVDILGVGYDAALGGDLLTERVRDLLVEKFAAQNGGTEVSEAKSLNRLWAEAEKIKKVLSANSEAYVSVESLYNGVDFRCVLTREEFESSTKDLLPRIRQVLSSAVSGNLMPQTNEQMDLWQNVESVMLMGGSTRVPFVQQALTAEMAESGAEVPLAKNLNTDEAGVMGATLRGVAVSKMFKAKDVFVFDRSLREVKAEFAPQLGGSETREMAVFPRGVPAGSTAEISVAVPAEALQSKADIRVALFEDGVALGDIVVENVAQQVEKLVKSSAFVAEDGLTVRIVLRLGEDKLVAVESAVAEIVAQPGGLLSKLLGKNVAESEDDLADDSEPQTATETGSEAGSEAEAEAETGKPNNNTTKPQTRQKLTTKTAFSPPAAGMSRNRLWELKQKLAEIMRKEQERITREELLNELENGVYRLREFLQDATETVESVGNQQLTEQFGKVQEFVSELATWVDENTESAKLKELQTRKSQLEETRQKFETQLTKAVDPTRFAQQTLSETNAEFSDLEHVMEKIRKDVARVAAELHKNGVSLSQFNAAINAKERYKDVWIELPAVEEVLKNSHVMLEEMEARLAEWAASGVPEEELAAFVARLTEMKKLAAELKEKLTVFYRSPYIAKSRSLVKTFLKKLAEKSQAKSGETEAENAGAQTGPEEDQGSAKEEFEGAEAEAEADSEKSQYHDEL